MSHPYSKLERTKTWKVIARAVADLEKNQDVVLQTKKEYVIGYLTSRLEPSVPVEAQTKSRKRKK